MGYQVLPQNEFFIYVPALQNDKLHSHDTGVDEKDNFYCEAANLPSKLSAWVKVPLAGTVCVYVSPDQVCKEVVCCS